MSGENAEVFGKYVLLERLAAGGMGEVFLARSGAKGFEKFFALKRILSQHAESPEFVQMLLNEARISVMLVHPNIAQLFEFGQIDQSFFMALEYVEGLSLNGIVRRGRERRILMRQADAVWIALQVCRALHYAHKKRDNDGNDLKIVHRDISPHNILVDETGSVKLIDFGIAKAAQGQIQTEASTIKGKIPYMSPEQASGVPIDSRSDLYSLGIVLYECLTFERMYPSGNTFETFALVRRGTLPDLDAVLGPKVPASLLALLKRCLQRDCDARYQTAAELESDLSRILHELEPGHTSYALADLVMQLDSERGERKQRLKSYSKISPENILARGRRASELPPEASPEQKLLAPPLPEVTMGSFAIDTAVSQLKTVTGNKAKGDGTPTPATAPGAMLESAPPSLLPSASSARNRAPLFAGIAIAVVSAVSAAVVINGSERGTQPAADAGSAPVVALVAPPATTTAPPPATTAPPPATTTAAPPATTPATTNKKVVKKEKAAKGSGCVAVNVKPWAYVSENGKRLGQTPLPCLTLSAGKHTLTLENPVVGKSKSVDVVVKADDTVKVIESL